MIFREITINQKNNHDFLSDAYYLNVSAIIGQDAEIPCELTPHTKTDNAYLVLWWFDDIFGTPIYR